VNPWTDEEIRTLIRLWPTHSAMQIANTLHRSYSAIRSRAKLLCKEGFLESRSTTRRGPSIKPNPEDFDEVKRDYCRRNHISFAELSERFERDDRLAAELYRRALEARLTRLRSRRVGGKTPGTGSSLVPASAANGAPTRLRRS
jgi:hypothetical protein